MGICDRDYMKRRPDDDDTESKAEEIAQRFLNNLPRLLLYCGIAVVILALIAFVVLKIVAASHQSV